MRLIEVDLSRAHEHDHPDIKTGPQDWYLALIDDSYVSGYFYRAWFGLSFAGGNYTRQFDAPRWNHSRWVRLWEIRPDDDEEGQPEHEVGEVERHPRRITL